ncbi:MAG TPA: amidohydrolase family protein [Vicinamibacterales bacterium]|nr:amidohydrolase family protein [Vicinamibacterales bacterium]
MTSKTRLTASLSAAAIAFVVGARADAPIAYAVRGARIVTAAGAPIQNGTIVLRNGLIEAVGADVQAPADAVVIDGSGMTVYPGLIDMGNSNGMDVQANPTPPGNFATTEDQERWKRSVIFRPDVAAADHLNPGAPELARLAAAGVTTVLATPPGSLVRGQSALVNIAAPPDDPQIGAVADPRKGLQVVRTPVALHVNLGASGGRGGYPASLMGSIAFVRQHFIDAQHQQAARQHYERAKAGTARPIYDASLDALQPALARRLPVAFEAGEAREILRALTMAKEFNLDPVITGASEADQVTADLKAQNARVVYNLNYQVRSRALPPDADEPIRVLRARAQAPKVPAALEKAGILYAFSADGIREPRDFVRNAARAVKEGLAADAAVRALTINAARIAGADERLGSLERGKIANVIVTEGDLFEEKTRVRHVFVDGFKVNIEETPAQGGRGRGRGGN